MYAVLLWQPALWPGCLAVCSPAVQSCCQCRAVQVPGHPEAGVRVASWF